MKKFEKENTVQLSVLDKTHEVSFLDSMILQDVPLWHLIRIVKR